MSKLVSAIPFQDLTQRFLDLEVFAKRIFVQTAHFCCMYCDIRNKRQCSYKVSVGSQSVTLFEFPTCLFGLSDLGFL